MRKSIYRKSIWDFLKSVIVPLIFTLAVMGMIVYGLRQTEESNKSEGLRILEDSIRRAVVISYAVEGRYPESVAHLEEKYGIHIDRSKYTVHYDIFASNLMPNIVVFELAGMN